MKKYPLISISIAVVFMIIVASFTNVVGIQSIESSNNKITTDEIDQKNLLFQTIIDINNNKEIQQIIQKYQTSRKGFFNPIKKLSGLNYPTLTKNQLKKMYSIGLRLSKFISKSKIQSMVQEHQLISPEMQNEITAVIEKNVTIKEEITQLLNTDCDCETSKKWGFQIICATILIMMFLWAIPLQLLIMIIAVLLFPSPTIFQLIGLFIYSLYPFMILYQLFNCPLPYQDHAPFVSDISPANGELIVFLENLTELRFRLTDEDGDPINYKVETSPYIGEGAGTSVPNGTYTIPIHGLKNSTTYTWDVYLQVNDSYGTWFRNRFTFTTAPIAPVISNPIPKQNAVYVPISTSYISFDLMDYQGDLMNWMVETQPYIGSASAHGVGNGSYVVAIQGLDYEKKYTWFLNTTDGTYWANKTYVFTTTSEGLLIFEPIADTMVYDYAPTSNYGSSHRIIVYNNNRSMGLVLFDLSGIPEGSTIISANLSLFYYDYDLETPVGREIACHRILEPWDEMTVTFNTRPDIDHVECASAIVPENYTWVNWNVTSEVNDFIYGGDMNYGWMIRDNKPYSSHNIREFYYSLDANNEYPPRLFVWFDNP